MGTVYGVVSNAAEQVTDASEGGQKRSVEMQRTDVTITSADCRDHTLRLEVENTGDATLSVSSTDLLFDGEYIVEESRTSTVSGSDNTDVWVQGETLNLSVDMPAPDRVKTVTKYGTAAVAAVEVFSLTANVAFTDGSDSLRSYGVDNEFTDYPGTATAVGTPVSNFVTEDTKEIPSVNSSGDVVKTPMATGNLDGDDPLEIHFVGSGNDELKLLDNATVGNTVKTVTDSGGGSTAADDDAGVA